MKTLSKKNPYYLSDARKRELVYFCRQYPEWEALYNGCVIIPGAIPEKEHVNNTPTESDVEKISEKREALKFKMDMVLDCAKRVDEPFSKYIFWSVTQGISYDELWKKTMLPISRSSFYALWHKFFWLLDQVKD